MAGEIAVLVQRSYVMAPRDAATGICLLSLVPSTAQWDRDKGSGQAL